MKDKIEKIKCLIFDFDGVMTDNKVIVFDDGKEAVICNRGDGQGINILKDLDYKMMILSTETNSVVKFRAEKLGLEVIQGSKNKKKDLLNWLKTQEYSLDEIGYVGNDINDLEVMQVVCLKVSPADAASEILEISDIITKKNGGDGVIRELANILKIDFSCEKL